MSEDLHFPGPQAFWAIVPLAIAVMLQPSGRPCGFHFCHRFFLRINPLVCGADTISVLVRFLTNSLAGLPYRKAATAVLESRYRCCEACVESFEKEEIKDLEKQIFLQFINAVYMIVPSIKLLVVSGMPMTKAAAIMYLANYLLIWFLAFFADLRPLQPTSAKVNHREMLEYKLQRRWDGQMERFHAYLGSFTMFLPMIMFFTVSAATFSGTSAWKSEDIHGAIAFIPIASISLISQLASSFLYAENLWTALLIPFSLAYPFVASIGVRFIRTKVLKIDEGLILWYVVLGIQAGIALFCSGSMVLLRQKSEFVRKNLFFMVAESPSPGSMASRAQSPVFFLQFILIPACAISFYYIAFDAEKTMKPQWLEFLG